MSLRHIRVKNAIKIIHRNIEVFYKYLKNHSYIHELLKLKYIVPNHPNIEKVYMIYNSELCIFKYVNKSI